MVTSYLKYLWQRKSKYKVHSPFVYDFMTKVLYDKGSNTDYDTMLRISRLLDGKRYATRLRRKEARLLYRLVNYLEPDAVVSFGSLSALNTTALALGNLQTKVYLDHSSDFLETMNSMGVVNVNLLRRDKPEQEQLERLSLDYDLLGNRQRTARLVLASQANGGHADNDAGSSGIRNPAVAAVGGKRYDVHIRLSRGLSGLLRPT